MIYTGNNGRIYIARQVDAGIQGSFTLNVVEGLAVALNETFSVFNSRGDGRGARVRAASAVSANASSRSIVFNVISKGTNYAAGDRVYFGRTPKGNLVRITPDFTIGTTATVGVDNEREILNDQYRIAKVRNWTLNSSSEVVETTALGDAVKTFSPSITSGEGSATLMFYEDDSSNRSGENAQKDTFELIDILFPRGTPPRVVLNLAVDGSATGISGEVGGQALWKTNFLFNAYITGASVGVNYGEVVTIDTSFTIDGPLLDVPWKPNVDRL
jgi:hypothetical protein